MDKKDKHLAVQYVSVSELKPAPYNPRKFNEEQKQQLITSIERFGLVDPIVANSTSKRKNIIIGGNFRFKVAKELGYKEVPVVYVSIADKKKEQELNIRLNKNTGEFDFELLAGFDESFLEDIGFDTSELDTIFDEDNPETFDLKKELGKLDIKKVVAKKQEVYQLGPHRLMIGDSTVESDILALMNGTKADMCLTDPPYILDYLNGKKKHGEATEGFGAKRNRRYLETDVLPDNFTELWMGNVAQIAKDDFSIIVYENWKNLRTIWSEMEKHWKVRNMIVWHSANRNQGFAASNKFFSKHDIAMVGTSEEHKGLNLEPEADDLLENEYQTALYAIKGHPHWEGYKKGSKYCPTDFIDFKAADEKSSGQGIIFGTKPLEILIPYLKVLTKRGDVVVEPFGGSGSTLMAAEKLKRTCYIMEKSPVYAEVIMKRYEKLTGTKRKKL